MDARASDASDLEQRLDEVATAYLKAAEAGPPPDRQAWLDRYPGIQIQRGAYEQTGRADGADPGKTVLGHRGAPRDADAG